MPSPFGFSVLSKLFAYLGTDREWPLQVAPFLAGLAFIPVFYLVIRRVVQRPEITALACLVVACHPVAELYATRVKHYTLDALVRKQALAMPHTRGVHDPSKPEA
jgi:4-amino-4-deoxy-L-arabinose transferase-like glycosyltransferase